MFGWVGRLIRNRSLSDRFIFRYHDGSRKRSADPVEVERVLIRHLGDDWRDKLASLDKKVPFGVIGDELERAKKERDELRRKIVAATDEAFDLKPFKDDVGLVEPMRLGILIGYCRFCIDLVELARPFPKPSSPTSPSPVA